MGRGPSRPVGLTILSVWTVTVGSAILVASVVSVYGLKQIPRALYPTFAGFPAGLVLIAAGVFAVHVVTAYGLWHLRPWGRLLAYALALLGVAVGMLTLPFGVIGVVVSLTTAWYLTDPRTRGLFRSARPK